MESGPGQPRRVRLAALARPRHFTTCGPTLPEGAGAGAGANAGAGAGKPLRAAGSPLTLDDLATSPVPAAPVRLVTGARLGRYVIVSALGAGSMGTVFEALDTELDRAVALKVVRPRPEIMDAARARLRREARAMARLGHPSVAAVFDVGEAGEHLYLAMELVRGGTLRSFVDQTRPWRTELRALIDVGHGIAAAHEAGVIHRDVKPDNILVRTDGAVRLADFGVACEPGERQERGPEVAGTVAYMAPEGLDGVADATSDQFAFAVMAFEVLEKQLPLALVSSVDAHRRALREAPRAPWRRRGIPVRVRRAIERAMAADPAERWPSMQALCAALEAGLDPSSRRSRGAGGGRRYRPARRRIG